jgi:hypothetical protein
MDAGTSASIGAIQSPQKTLAATKDSKLFASAAQKQEIIKPTVVPRYTGRFPYFTARELNIRLPIAIAAIVPPWTADTNVDRETPKSAASGTKAPPRSGPTAKDGMNQTSALYTFQNIYLPPTHPQPHPNAIVNNSFCLRGQL